MHCSILHIEDATLTDVSRNVKDAHSGNFIGCRNVPHFRQCDEDISVVPRSPQVAAFTLATHGSLQLGSKTLVPNYSDHDKNEISEAAENSTHDILAQ